MSFNKKAEDKTEEKDIVKARKRRKSKKKLIIIIAICLILAGIGGYYVHNHFFKTRETKSETTEAKVTRGSIVNVIEGSGTIEAKAQYEVKYLNSVDVVADYFEEGDYVKKNQILYKMDSEDIERNITKQKRSVERAQMNYEDALSTKSDYNVKSDISGVITEFYVSKGDNVSNGTKICDIVDKDKLLMSIPFGGDDARNISYGDKAEVTLMNSSMPLYGSVTNVGSGTYINSYGVEVTDVEITLSNPGGVGEGTYATAMVGEYACYDSAVLEYANTKTIVAKASGEVLSVNKKKGDLVSAGTTLVGLDGSKTDRTIKEAKLSLDDANSSLEQLIESKNDATIRSEIDGKVIQKNIKAGEILDSNTSSTMAIIADLSSLKFNMSIDELDISKINVGQDVTITADALSGQTFHGTVTNVSIVGSAYQGVTSYPVTVTIDNTEETDLIPGMNVEAQIVIDSADNVLRVPVSALRMGNLVIVKDDGTFADPLKMNFRPGSLPGEGGSDKGSSDKPVGEKTASDEKTNAPTGDSEKMQRPVRDSQFADGAPSEKREKASSDEKSSNQSEGQQERKSGAPGDSSDMREKMEERMKSMIEGLDVPEGYTVVRVQTGLNDGSYVEIKETEGSLKEGDTILIPVVISSADNTNMQGMYGGMRGGMPGGGMPGGGMPGGMGAARQGSMGANRQGGMR